MKNLIQENLGFLEEQFEQYSSLSGTDEAAGSFRFGLAKNCLTEIRKKIEIEMLWEDSYSLESLLNKLCLHITKQLHKEKINVSFMVNSRGKILKPLVPEVTN